MKKNEKKIQSLIEEYKKEIETRSIRNEREDFRAKGWDLMSQRLLFNPPTILKTIDAYPLAAYYTNLLNNLVNGNISVRRSTPLYKQELGREIFKNEKFAIVIDKSWEWEQKLNIENIAKSKISAILTEALFGKKSISAKPKDVFEYIKGKNPSKLSDKTELNTIFFEYSDNKDIRNVRRLMFMELIEDTYRYMGEYLQSHRIEEKFNEMHTFSQIISSNESFSMAFLNIALSDNANSIPDELAGSFILALRNYNIPVLEMVKENQKEKMAAFIVNAVKKISLFLSEEQMYEIDKGLALSFAVKDHMLSTSEIINNSDYQFLYERVKLYFQDARTQTEIERINKDKKYIININQAWKDTFENHYQINPKDLKEIIDNTHLYKSYKEDLTLGIGDMIKEGFKNSNEKLDKSIVLKVDISEVFENLKFSNNKANIILFDKGMEIFLETCLQAKFPNVSVKSLSSSIKSKDYDKYLKNLLSEQDVKNNILNISSRFLSKPNQLQIIVPYENINEVGKIEKLANAVVSTQAMLVNKGIKESQIIANKGYNQNSDKYASNFLLINAMKILTDTLKDKSCQILIDAILAEQRAHELSEVMSTSDVNIPRKKL